MKELDEAINNLWWVGEISDEAKMWWDDHYKKALLEEASK